LSQAQQRSTQDSLPAATVDIAHDDLRRSRDRLAGVAQNAI
jgi:hypothetical protein